MPATDASTLTWDDLHAWSEDADFEPGTAQPAAARAVHAVTAAISHHGLVKDGRFDAVAWLVASDVDEYFHQHTPSTRPIQHTLIEIAGLMNQADGEINGADDAPRFVTHATVSALETALQRLGRAIEDWKIGLEGRGDL